MSNDQKKCYKLVNAVKAPKLPMDLLEITRGPNWRETYLPVDHKLSSNNFKVLELLVKFCIQYYFNIYFDIKVKHHQSWKVVLTNLLTQLRILRTQPYKVCDALTFYVRTSAWYSHSKCLLLTLLTSSDSKDRRIAKLK